MTVQDAQRNVRTVFVGGFWGHMVSSVLWLVSAALGTWVSPRAAAGEIVFRQLFHFPTHSYVADCQAALHRRPGQSVE